MPLAQRNWLAPRASARARPRCGDLSGRKLAEDRRGDLTPTRLAAGTPFFYEGPLRVKVTGGSHSSIRAWGVAPAQGFESVTAQSLHER